MMGLFEEPAAHRIGDPDTSRHAKKFRLNEDRVAVLEMHARHPYGLTDFELADYMGRQQTSVGKRRGELRDHGYVEETPIRRPAPSGSSAIVWGITTHGLILNQKLREMRELFGEIVFG